MYFNGTGIWGGETIKLMFKQQDFQMFGLKLNRYE